MDVQLKELIEKIKTEGVQTAEQQAASIIADAEKKAADIIKKAQDSSARTMEAAEREVEKLRISGNEALAQAGRNLLLGLKDRIEKMFHTVVVEESGKALSGKNLEDVIARVVGSMKPEELQSMDILVGKKDLDELEGGLKKALSDALKAGLELKPVESSASGFRLAEKDGSAYYNYTAEGVADILCEYLNPRLSKLLREAVREG